jgi:hypothetical protein
MSDQATLAGQYIQRVNTHIRTVGFGWMTSGANDELADRLRVALACLVLFDPTEEATRRQISRCLGITMDAILMTLTTQTVLLARGDLRPLTAARLDGLVRALELVTQNTLIEGTELTMLSDMRGAEQLERGRLNKTMRMATIATGMLVLARQYLEGSSTAAAEIGKAFFDFLEVQGAGSDLMVEIAEQLTERPDGG